VRQLEHGQIIATIGHPRTPAPGSGTAAHELKPLPLPPADDDFDRPTSPRVRFQELAQVWVITYSLLLDRVCGTTYLSIYVILNILS